MKLCGFDIGLDKRIFLIAGPCVIESEQLQMDTAGALKEMTSALGIPFIFKSSFDKANRSSGGTCTLKNKSPKSRLWLMCCKPQRSYAAKPISSVQLHKAASR
jgi:hypothetical protein